MTAYTKYNSGYFEWYTPKYIIDMVNKVFKIDLDPASCIDANFIVGAKKIYTIKDNGLLKDWNGNVFINPPYSRNTIFDFSNKLVDEINSGRLKQCISLFHNSTETKWGQMLLNKCNAVCFPSGRIKYLGPKLVKSSPLQGNMILYFGKNKIKFKKVFDGIGFTLLSP